MRLCLALLTLALAACAAPSAPYLPTGPDTVPNAVSCHFRGPGFCHPQLVEI